MSVIALLNWRQEPPVLTRAKENVAANAERLDRQVSARVRSCKEGENFWDRLTPEFKKCLDDFESSQKRLGSIARSVGRMAEVEQVVLPIPEQVRCEGLRDILKEAKHIIDPR